MLRRGWPALVLAVALAVRLWGITWQLPAALYFDELKYVERAGGAVRGDPPDPIDFRNPTLFWHVLEDEYWLAALVRPIADVQEAAVFQLALARVTSAVLGAAACLLTGLAAARLSSGARSSRKRGESAGTWTTCQGPATGLAAGLILALAPLAVQLSHYAVNDTAASFVMAAGLLVGARALTAPTWSEYLLGGVLAGIAAATKYNFGVVLVLPLVVAILPTVAGSLARSPLVPSRVPVGKAAASVADGACPRTACDSWRLALAYSALVVGGFALGLTAGMPEVATSPIQVLAGMKEQARMGAIHWNGQSATPTWQLYADALVRALGLPALLFAAGGAVALARRDRSALIALLGVPVAYLAIMLGQELFFARFALPLLPALAILGGLGIGALVELGPRRAGGPAVVGKFLGALLIALLPPAIGTVRLDRLATTTDTRVLAQRWLDEHAAGARVVTETYGLPIDWSGAPPPRGYHLQRVATLADPSIVRRLARGGARYFVTSSLVADHGMPHHPAPAGETGNDLLVHLARVSATFDPFKPGDTAPAHPDDTGIPFWYLDAYARPGPVVTIFELSEGAIPCQ